MMYKNRVDAVATSSLKRAVKQYANATSGGRHLLDWGQQLLQCCGVSGSGDYYWTRGRCHGGRYNGVPSCHVDNNCNKHRYTVGCKQRFIDLIKSNLMTIGGFALGIAFIQLLGIVFACCLKKAIKEQYEPIA